MKVLLLVLACVVAQLPSRDSEPTVVLPSNHATITADLGGKYVQLKNSPATVVLPKDPPKTLSSGLPWYVDVVNFGPNEVTLEGIGQFSVHMRPKDIVRVMFSGSTYKVVH
ncbi:MAG: hypothetical protein JOZ33_14045 [Acidobacteriaceae bacterium]|nr:hypothetical protein [Acidobacteriaceae bacterium]